MLIKSFHKVEAAGEVVPISHGNSTAVRVLLKHHGLGFSLSEARRGANSESTLWYKNHWEANYIRAGHGNLTNQRTGESWALSPGMLYCVGPDDKHLVSNADDPLRIISVFNPPIEGLETHDSDGSYPPTGDVPEGLAEMFVRSPEGVRQAGGEKVLGGGSVIASRLLTAHDKLGFSLSEVIVKAGTNIDLWYKYHWEANLVIDGTVIVTELDSGKQHTLSQGDVYCVGPKDRHRLEPQTDLKLVAIFNPPLTGEEQHDEDGSYPPTGVTPKGPE